MGKGLPRMLANRLSRPHKADKLRRRMHLSVRGVELAGRRLPTEELPSGDYLFFSLPRGITVVTGAMGRSEGLPPLGGEVSFFGLRDIFSLRCSLPMNAP